MKGKLIGVGVGPGDPELLTIKAIETIKRCEFIAVPGKEKKESAAYKIASQAIELDSKECLTIYMPMTKDTKELNRSHAEGIHKIIKILDTGRDIAFLTLGDPTVYSTYIYIHKGIIEKGYAAEIVNGIPSFCAAAARLNISLTEKSEQLHIIPASYQVDEALKMEGTRVFMKAGSTMSLLKEKLVNERGEIYMVENCGTENEKLTYGAGQMNEHAGYYSLVILKEQQ